MNQENKKQNHFLVTKKQLVLQVTTKNPMRIAIRREKNIVGFVFIFLPDAAHHSQEKKNCSST